MSTSVSAFKIIVTQTIFYWLLYYVLWVMLLNLVHSIMKFHILGKLFLFLKNHSRIRCTYLFNIKMFIKERLKMKLQNCYEKSKNFPSNCPKNLSFDGFFVLLRISILCRYNYAITQVFYIRFRKIYQKLCHCSVIKAN